MQEPRIRFHSKLLRGLNWDIDSAGPEIPCRLLPWHPADALLIREGEFDVESEESELARAAGIDDEPERVTMLRHIAFSWLTTLVIKDGGRNDRSSISLPEDARKAGVIPGAGEPGILMLLGRTAEIWRPERLLSHCQETRAEVLDRLVRREST